MNFKEWLKRFENEQSPIGDLSRDNNQDLVFPNSYSYKRIRSHMEKQNASELCMKSFEDAWALYKNKISPKGK